jgi:hypothetical protein
MDKNELKTKLEEVKNLIKTNSKDADYAETLLNELLSTHGQLKHEPTLVNVPLKDIEKEADGETFVMATTKDGKAIYHTRGGYTVIADSNYSSLFYTIYNLIDYINGTVELDEETKNILEADTIATSYILNIPMYVMDDFEYKASLFENVLNYLTKRVEESEKELQDETPDENREFQNAVEALNALQGE